MLYSVNILRNLQRRKCFKVITENSKTMVRPHREFFLCMLCSHPPVSHLALAWNWRSSKEHNLEEKLSSYPFLFPFFLSLVRFREEQNFKNPGMCSISYFVIKHRSENHSWWTNSKATRNWCNRFYLPISYDKNGYRFTVQWYYMLILLTYSSVSLLNWAFIYSDENILSSSQFGHTSSSWRGG